MADIPRCPDEIYEDFLQRRAGLLCALTTDVDRFYAACDPEKQNLCLYGERSGTWSVELPAEEVPPELPEPALGINFARDGMERRDWLALVAVHSDAWLMATAFFYAVRLDAVGRSRLFALINKHQTLFEAVTSRAKSDMGGSGLAKLGNGSGTKRKQEGQMPEAYTGTGSASGSQQPSAGTRQLLPTDVSPMLINAMAELFWPDDGLWYPVQIRHLDSDSRTAKIVYLPGLEQEDLDLDEIIRDGHMMLQTR